MNKKALYLLITVGLFFSIGLVSAQTVENPLKAAGINDFPTLLEKIATAVGGIVASLAFLMLIVAGIFFLLSAGNPNMLGRAKQALTYAIIGAAIGLAAGALVGLLKAVVGV
jgi:hypothetical protein